MVKKRRQYRNYNIPKEDEISYKQDSYQRRKKKEESPICDRHIDSA